MKIFPAKEVHEIDRFTIEHEPIASIDLMERAADQLLDWIVRRFRTSHQVMVFVGPGNNGGDGLALARMLADRQYDVTCCLLAELRKFSPDGLENFERMHSQDLVDIIHVKAVEEIPEIGEDTIIIDAIFGSGLSRKVEGAFAAIIQAINFLPNKTVAIDIPSGLFGEDNRNNNDSSIIKADYTLSFQFPFLSFFFQENEKFVGEWHVLDIGLHPKVIEAKLVDYITLEKEAFMHRIPERGKFSHKGNFGHAVIIGGSYGMMGAVLLASKAILRSGAGLVTAHIPKCGVQILQTAFPEAIASVDDNEECISEAPHLRNFNAVAIGPGLGESNSVRDAIISLLDNIQVPLVIDADALNIISQHKELIYKIPEGSVLTPHPKEFDRLFGESEDTYERHLKQIEHSKRYKLIIVLKGAYTGVSFPDGRYFFNTNGNPGMATAGSGDVLTGIIVSLMAQEMRADFAALAGVYLHGLAGNIAAEEHGEAGMIAGDIISSLGRAWMKLTQISY